MTARQAVQFVELDLVYGSCTFGVSPCTAAIEGITFVPAYEAVFDDTLADWTPSGYSAETTPDGAVLTSSNGDPQFISPSGLSIDGGANALVLVDVERIADGGEWQGTLYYAASSGHGFSESYRKRFDDVEVGQRTIYSLDLADLSNSPDAGDDDWPTSTITQLRLDLDQASGSAFRVRSVKVGHIATAEDATGTAKCFNTIATCQDLPNFQPGTATLRFTEPSALPMLSVEAIPNVRSLNYTGGRINPGKDLGDRSVLRLVLGDHPHSDVGPGYDKYHAERPFDPYTQGTWAGKLRARQPYIRGAAVRWYLGYADQSPEEMEVRHYVVESFDGPNVDGTYTLVAVDPLKMMDGDRSQAPRVNTGRLSATLGDSATSCTLTPAGIGDLQYAASGKLAIAGSEAVTFTRSGDSLTITRGQLNTSAIEHDAGDRVQTVLEYISMDPADILYDLIVNYTPIPASYIPLEEWQEETATYLRREYTARIAEPTPVAQLVAEIMRDCGLSIWWDDLAAKIRLRVLRPLAMSGVAFDDGNILEGTFTRKEQPDKRVSQVWVYFAQRNPLAGLEDNDNYQQVAVTADGDSEANFGTPSIRKIYSRWIPGGGQSAAERAGNLIIGRYATPPRLFTFQLMRDAQEAPRLGHSYATAWLTEQNPDGSSEEVQGSIIRMTPGKTRFAVELEEERFISLDAEDLNTRSITVNYDTLDVNMRAMHDENYPDPIDGITVNFIVEANTYLGATLTSIPALRTGTWPSRQITGNRTNGSAIITGIADTAGLVEGQRVSGTGIPAGSKIVSIEENSSITLDKNATSGSGTATTLTVYTVILNVIIRGNVYGRGGDGGRGANGSGDSDGQNGFPGGPALKVEYPIFLTDAEGTLAGGGGGGGGGPCRDPNDHKGGGGGGGQGELGGAGGIGPGNGREGQPGSRTAPGAGGHGWTNANFFRGPGDDSRRRGGNGGGLGQPGQKGQGNSDLDAGNGGAAGAAIDGISLVVTVGSAGTRLGSQMN